MFQCALMSRKSVLSIFSSRVLQYYGCRRYCSGKKKGLVVGVYQEEEKKDTVLTSSADQFDKKSGGKLSEILPLFGDKLKLGKSRLLYDNGTDPKIIAVVGLGSIDKTEISKTEARDESKEAIRTAIAAGVLSLRDAGCSDIEVDGCGDNLAAAEAASLALFSYDELKKPKSRKPPVNLTLYSEPSQSDWDTGLKYASGQNLARRLMETPASHMTPTILSREAVENLEPLGVKVKVMDKDWCKEQGMGAFLSVTSGSSEPPVFIHATYTPPGSEDQNPLCLVGKGITFDSGGISLKPSLNMDSMRADMGGAAVILGALYTIAKLKLPIQVHAFIPSCENMPGNNATRPGDVVVAMNGKSIQVDNTDAEGRLILADALCYAEKVTKPRLIIDMATLTGAMSVALGSSAAGVFTVSDSAFQLLEKAGQVTGDRVWRMPLWKHYTKQISEAPLADLNNIGTTRTGGACTAAAFLKEFVTTTEWMHIDIAGVMSNKDEVPYLSKGMAGRPARTIAHMVSLMTKA